MSKLSNDEILIFAAGLSGGISFIVERPSDLFSINTEMIYNFISAAERKGIERVLN